MSENNDDKQKRKRVPKSVKVEITSKKKSVKPDSDTKAPSKGDSLFKKQPPKSADVPMDDFADDDAEHSSKSFQLFDDEFEDSDEIAAETTI